MDRRNQVAGVLSPVFSFNKHTDIYNENHLTSHINILEKNQYNQDIDIHSNSSTKHILSISGSHNRGWMLNDALFNVTNIFQRPIFLNINQYPLLYYSTLVFTAVFFILMILLYFVHYRHRLLSSPHRQQQQQQQQQQEKQLWYFVPLNKSQARLPNRNSFPAKDKTTKVKFITKQSRQWDGNVDRHKSVTITGMDASQEIEKVNISIDCSYFFHVHIYMYIYVYIDPPVCKEINGGKSPTIE